MSMTVSLVVGTEGDTVRTELTDLLYEFFTMVLDDRQYTLWGRSLNSDIPDEDYQIVIIDKDVALAGEQEVPRPDDPKRKIYINRLNIPILMMQYTDRTVQMGVSALEDSGLPGVENARPPPPFVPIIGSPPAPPVITSPVDGFTYIVPGV
jgi:hypothetical protein